MTGDKFCDYCNMANGLHAVNCPNRAYFGARAHGGNALITEAAQLRAANGQLASAVTTARSQVDTLRAEVERCRLEKWCEETQVPRLVAELATARDLLADVWAQFAVPGKDGKLWAGGLSTLEAVDRALHAEGKKP